jgi:hypothetical protein
VRSAVQRINDAKGDVVSERSVNLCGFVYKLLRQHCANADGDVFADWHTGIGRQPRQRPGCTLKRGARAPREVLPIVSHLSADS